MTKILAAIISYIWQLMILFLSGWPRVEGPSQDNVMWMRKGRWAEVRSTPLDPISSCLQVGTHGATARPRVEPGKSIWEWLCSTQCQCCAGFHWAHFVGHPHPTLVCFCFTSRHVQFFLADWPQTTQLLWPAAVRELEVPKNPQASLNDCMEAEQAWRPSCLAAGRETVRCNICSMFPCRTGPTLCWMDLPEIISFLACTSSWSCWPHSPTAFPRKHFLGNSFYVNPPPRICSGEPDLRGHSANQTHNPE